MPSNNARLNPSIILHFCALKNDASLQTHTVTYLNIRSNHYIGPNTASLSYLGRWMHHDIALVNIIGICAGQLLRMLLGKMAEI